MRELQARDVTSSGTDASLLEVGALRTCFLLASEVTDAYACIPLAHIVECRADKQVVLDEGFIPTVLDSRVARRLATFDGVAGPSASARRSARRPRRSHRTRLRRGDRRLPDAAGDQSIRTAACASC